MTAEQLDPLPENTLIYPMGSDFYGDIQGNDLKIYDGDGEFIVSAYVAHIPKAGYKDLIYIVERAYRTGRNEGEKIGESGLQRRMLAAIGAPSQEEFDDLRVKVYSMEGGKCHDSTNFREVIS